jgi:hypothetical protein
MKKPSKDKKAAFSAESFIAKAATATSDAVPKKSAPRRSTKSKPAAAGFIRASFDLPEALHERLRVAAAKQRRKMREIVEEGLTAALKRSGF